MAEKSMLATNGQDTAPRRWDPMEMFEAFQAEMDRLWRGPGLEMPVALAPLFRRVNAPAITWTPRIDVYDEDTVLIVKAELPGLKKEDVQVELDRGGLVIRGESKAEKETKEGQYYRMERSVGSYYRRLALPFEVKADQIHATLTDGVLGVRINRPAELKPESKKIPIS